MRELTELGVDAIRLYAFLKPDVVAAVIEEAHALGVPVIGDLVSTPWATALDAGIDGFVHVMDHKWRFISPICCARCIGRACAGWRARTRVRAACWTSCRSTREIGIPNATILQTATSNVARWLKRDDFGTVEPGKRADLILVDGDPLVRIRDLENIVLVVQSGRVYLEK